MCIIIPTLQPAAYGQLSQPIVSSDSIHLERNDAYGGIIISHILASSFSLLLSSLSTILICMLFPPLCTPYIPLLPHFFSPLLPWLLLYVPFLHEATVFGTAEDEYEPILPRPLPPTIVPSETAALVRGEQGHNYEYITTP